jgi:hypothetical protein
MRSAPGGRIVKKSGKKNADAIGGGPRRMPAVYGYSASLFDWQ